MSNLIEQIEETTGKRWDDADDQTALATLFGAVARAMGENPHGPKDEYAAGTLLIHQIEQELSGEAARRRAMDAMLAEMLIAGISPDTIGAMCEKDEKR